MTSTEDKNPRELLRPNADTDSPILPLRQGADRFAAIDALRGLAVVLMVQQHLGVWLTAVHRVPGGLLRLVMGLNTLGGAAAPLFVFLTGVGVALATRLSARALIQRGIALALVGYLLNLACPSWFSLGSFYVLHLIAVFWLLAPALRRLPDGWLLGLYLVLLLLTVAAQTWLRTPPYLSNARLADVSLPLGALRLALAEGHFPVLPWLAFATLGLWAGRRLDGRPLGSLSLAAMVLATGFLASRVPRYFLRPVELRRLPLRSLTDFSFYPATVAFVVALSALCVLLLALAAKWGRGRSLFAPGLTVLGRTSLTLLFVHVVLFREGTEALGLYQRLHPLVAILLVVGLLVLWALLARAWARFDFRYSLEWWIRRAGLLRIS